MKPGAEISEHQQSQASDADGPELAPTLGVDVLVDIGDQQDGPMVEQMPDRAGSKPEDFIRRRLRLPGLEQARADIKP